MKTLESVKQLLQDLDGVETFERDEVSNNVILTWRCLGCGWTVNIAAPGFAGDGFTHYREGSPEGSCGPLVAYRRRVS